MVDIFLVANLAQGLCVGLGAVVRTMAGNNPRTLQSLWLDGPEGTLSPLQQLRAVAYRDALRECGHPEYGL